MSSIIKSELKKANFKLIELIEKHNCIWKTGEPEYNKKSEVQKAWIEISKETGDSVRTCFLHWQKIRRAYSRSFKLNQNGSYQKSDYYLANALEFLRTHIQIGRYLKDSSDIMENDTEDVLDEPEELTKVKDIAENDEEIERQFFDIIKMETQEVEEINFDKKVETIKIEDEDVKEMHINQNCISILLSDDDEPEVETNKVKDCSNEINITKKTHSDITKTSIPKEMHTDVQPNANKFKEPETDEVNPSSSLIDANRKFFESLIPFVDEMNTQQNRRFRREIMCLIDDVLDDKDIEGPNLTS